MFIRIRGYQDVPRGHWLNMIWNPALEMRPEHINRKYGTNKSERVCLVVADAETLKRRAAVAPEDQLPREKGSGRFTSVPSVPGQADSPTAQPGRANGKEVRFVVNTGKRSTSDLTTDQLLQDTVDYEEFLDHLQEGVRPAAAKTSEERHDYTTQEYAEFLKSKS